MPVPTSFTDLSTTPGSNSPAGGDAVFPDLDNFLRFIEACLASVKANTATNGWVSPYAALSGASFTGAVDGITNLTTTGNTILGNAQGDTLNVAAGAISVGASGNVGIAAPSSGTALAILTTGTNSGLSLSDGTITGLGRFVSSIFEFGTFSNHGVSLVANSQTRMAITAAGNFTIGTPSSGTTLAISPAAGGGNFIVATDGTATMQFATLGATGGLLGMNSDHKLELVTNSLPRISVAAAGNVTIAAPSSGYGLNIPTGTPASAAAAGTAGDIAWDSSYIYVCTAANTWKRAALSTW